MRGKGPLAIGQLLNLSVSQFSKRGREATGNKIVPVFQREKTSDKRKRERAKKQRDTPDRGQRKKKNSLSISKLIENIVHCQENKKEVPLVYTGTL